MNVGLLVDPEAMPDPHQFLELVAAELDVLAAAVLPASAVVDAVA